MGSSKSANRLPFGRDEGIWQALHGAEWDPHKVKCSLCGRVLSTSRLALAAHGWRHARNGEAIPSTEYSDNGPRTVFLPPAQSPHDESRARM